MNTSSNKIARFAALLGLAAGACQVAAHHAIAMFDHAQVVTIHGIVKEIRWANPHVGIRVEVARDGAAPVLWVIEMTSPGNLMRTGSWSRYSVKPGEKVAIELAPLRSGKPGGALKKMTLVQSGKFLMADIRAEESAIRP
jgi:hypothetical protein